MEKERADLFRRGVVGWTGRVAYLLGILIRFASHKAFFYHGLENRFTVYSTTAKEIVSAFLSEYRLRIQKPEHSFLGHHHHL